MSTTAGMAQIALSANSVAFVKRRNAVRILRCNTGTYLVRGSNANSHVYFRKAANGASIIKEALSSDRRARSAFLLLLGNHR